MEDLRSKYSTEHSPKSFFQGLDFLLAKYLHEISNVSSALRESLQKRPLSTCIVEILSGEIDFESAKVFSAEEFHDFLMRLKQFASVYAERSGIFHDTLPSLLEVQRDDMQLFHSTGRKWASYDAPLAFAGRRIFQDDRITTQDVILLENFFEFLIQAYFEETDNARERKRFIELGIQFQQFIRSCFELLLQSKLSGPEGNIFLHSLLEIRDSTLSVEQLEEFFQQAQAVKEPDTTTLMKEYREILQKIFPAQWLSQVVRERVRIIVFRPDNEADYIMFKPPENFFFHPPESENNPHIMNNFPLQKGRTLPRFIPGIIGYDVSVFSTSGEKVFWGDLAEEDIRTVPGTYYVLSSRDGFFQVPSWAQREVLYNPDISDIEETILMEINYMRAQAMGVIHNGKFIENAHRI